MEEQFEYEAGEDSPEAGTQTYYGDLNLPAPEPVAELALGTAGPIAEAPVVPAPAPFVSAVTPIMPLPVPQAETDSEPGKIAEDDAVAGLLSPFFHKGYVARKDARGLMDPAKREEAEKRLNAVGLTLAWSPYSRYYGLALADGPSGQKERITNMNELDRNALALLVIMWARLVLPQRLAEEGREGGVAEPTVSFQALDAEYGKKLGGRRFEMYVGQLKRLGFLEYTRKDEIKAGPFLDLLGDSNQLASYLRQSTLAKVMRDQPTAPEEAEELEDAAV